MENYEVSLLTDSEGAVLKAKNIRLNFQGAITVSGQPSGNIGDINLTVDADQESILRDGSILIGQMKQVAIRGAELETMLLTMPDGKEKTKFSAKLEIWKAFNTSVQSALTIALKEQYLLDNPVTA